MQQKKLIMAPTKSKGVPVIAKPSGKPLGSAPGKQVGGILGSAPGSVQQISPAEVRRLRQEIQNLRDTNQDLKDTLHEAR